MNSKVFGQLSSQLSTMGGFPGWSDTMADNYFLGLCDIPDELAARLVPLIQRKFDDRPSVKQLREWAAEVQTASSPGQLPAYLAPKAALTGPGACGILPAQSLTWIPQPTLTNPAASVMGLLTEAGRETKRQGGTIPPAAKEALRWLRQQAAKDGPAPVVGQADRGNWGLEYVKQSGDVERYPARYSEAAARAKCDDMARKHVHVRVRVWCAESAEAIRLDREKEAAA